MPPPVQLSYFVFSAEFIGNNSKTYAQVQADAANVLASAVTQLAALGPSYSILASGVTHDFNAIGQDVTEDYYEYANVVPFIPNPYPNILPFIWEVVPPLTFNTEFTGGHNYMLGWRAPHVALVSNTIITALPLTPNPGPFPFYWAVSWMAVLSNLPPSIAHPKVPPPPGILPLSFKIGLACERKIRLGM